MVSQKTTIRNLTGLNVRPAGIFCETAVKFKSKITFHYVGGVGNAKSVLNVLGAGIRNGETIEIVCDGEDEKEALLEMIKVIEDGLGE